MTFTLQEIFLLLKIGGIVAGCLLGGYLVFGKKWCSDIEASIKEIKIDELKNVAVQIANIKKEEIKELAQEISHIKESYITKAACSKQGTIHQQQHNGICDKVDKVHARIDEVNHMSEKKAEELKEYIKEKFESSDSTKKEWRIYYNEMVQKNADKLDTLMLKVANMEGGQS